MAILYGGARKIFSILTSYLVRGLDPTEAQQRYEQLYGAAPAGVMQQALTAAEQAEVIAANIRGMSGADVLREALGGLPAPAPTVRLSFLVQWNAPGQPKAYFLLRREVLWDETINASYALVFDEALERVQNSGGRQGSIFISIVPPTLYPGG
jgi:hypothetical protein